MKIKSIVSSLFISLCLLPQLHAQDNDWCNFGRYAEENARTGAAPKAVLFGDSITDIWATQRPEFFQENHLLGRGISGQTSSQILLRFRDDVIAHHPKYVAILCGVNDLALNDHYVSLEHAFGNLVSMCDLARANKIRPVLCTTTPASHIAWRPAVKDGKEQIQKLNQMIREYAKANKIRLVDYARALADEEGVTDARYSGDGIHPNAAGYEIMEALLIKALR